MSIFSTYPGGHKQLKELSGFGRHKPPFKHVVGKH
jgi:hypothetical protein